eukprot:GHVS01015831.1.p1 GENE.GHVS01015831.1~~GHVS01015831.1.p1  ORF type:complete len:156 (+),score=14.14 GHVS01015831.1:152-619(+)
MSTQFDKSRLTLRRMLYYGRKQIDGMKAAAEKKIRKVIAKRVEVHKAGQEQYRIKEIVYDGKVRQYELISQIQKQVHAVVARRAAALVLNDRGNLNDFRGIDNIIDGIIRGGKEKETTLMKKISASIKAVTDTFAAAENEQRKEDTEKCILRCPA